LQISDLINSNKIDSLKEKVFQDKTHFLKKYKAEKLIGYLAKNQIDSENYNGAIEQMDSNCINDVQIETFSLSNSFLK
jgi:hypothetical protein